MASKDRFIDAVAMVDTIAPRDRRSEVPGQGTWFEVVRFAMWLYIKRAPTNSGSRVIIGVVCKSNNIISVCTRK